MSPRRPELRLVRGNPAALRSRTHPSLRVLPDVSPHALSSSSTDGPSPDVVAPPQAEEKPKPRAPLAPPECIEVTISWGGNVMTVAHINPRDGYWVGSRVRPGRPGYVFPAHVFGPGPLPLVLPTRQGVVAVLPDHVTASISTSPAQRLLRAHGTTGGLLHRRVDVRGDCFPLTTGRCCWLEACGMQIRIAAVPRSQPWPSRSRRWPWMLLAVALMTHIAIAAFIAHRPHATALLSPTRSWASP